MINHDCVLEGITNSDSGLLDIGGIKLVENEGACSNGVAMEYSRNQDSKVYLYLLCVLCNRHTTRVEYKADVPTLSCRAI